MIEIRKVYTWYNIYNGRTMIAKNWNLLDVNSLIDVCKRTKTPYKITGNL